MTRHALNSTETSTKTSTKTSTTNHKCMEVLAAIFIKHSCLVSRAASGSGNLKLFKLQRPKQRSPIVGSFTSEPPLLNGFENTPQRNRVMILRKIKQHQMLNSQNLDQKLLWTKALHPIFGVVFQVLIGATKWPPTSGQSKIITPIMTYEL